MDSDRLDPRICHREEIVPDFKEAQPGTTGGYKTIAGLFYMVVIGIALYAIWET